MEWFIGLLIGVVWGAGFTSFVHWAHERERVEKATKAERVASGQDKGYKVRPNGMIEPKIKEPWYLPDTKEQIRQFHVNTTDVVDRLDNTPPDCSCDWQENKMICQKEGDWYRTRQDPECPVHKYGDACVRDYDKMVKRWVKAQAEPDEPIGDHKDWTHRTDL